MLQIPKKFFFIALVILMGSLFVVFRRSSPPATGVFLSASQIWKDPELKKLGPNESALKAKDAKILVIQLKDSDGVVAFHNPVSSQYEMGSQASIKDPQQFFRKLKKEGHHVVAYLQVFKDLSFARKFPTEAITNLDGSLFQDAFGAFIDPQSEKYKTYFFKLVKWILQWPIDELMLDYIRYPERLEPPLRFPYSGNPTREEKVQSISRFVQQLRSVLKKERPSLKLSVAVFPHGANVGQVVLRLNDGKAFRWSLLQHVDILTPMLYPSLSKDPFIEGEAFKTFFDGYISDMMLIAEKNRVQLRPFVQGFAFRPTKEPSQDGVKREIIFLPPSLMRWQLDRLRSLNLESIVFNSWSIYPNLWEALSDRDVRPHISSDNK